MIQLHSVSKRYRGARQAPVLDGVDLAVDAGEVVLLSGATGSGKTTLLGLLYGVHLADAGKVEMFGRDVARLRRSSIALLRQCLGVVPQELALIDERTALENVALALEIRAEPQRTMRARAAEVLGRFGLACHVDARASELSLGERQRLALARAWVTEPTVVIADEPSAHLDSAGREVLVAELSALQGRGGAALVATNDHKLLAAGARLGWRHVELSSGTLRVVADRKPQRKVMHSEDYEILEITAEIAGDRIANPDAPGGPYDDADDNADSSSGDSGASPHNRPRRPDSIDDLAFPEGLGDFHEPKADVVLFPLVASVGGVAE